MSGTKDEQANMTEEDSEQVYPSYKAFLVQAIAVFVGIFLVALDRSIVATAVPRITDTFNSIKDIGWYGTAYLLPLCSLQLFCGRLYAFHSTKWLFVSSVTLFEIGSAVCGSAPSSLALIIGRTIAGVGAAGTYSGSLAIFIEGLPLEKRPVFLAGIGGLMGICSVIGPLLGGAFTQNVTWRWCFYINLPLGAVAAVLILLVTKPRSKPKATSTVQAFRRLDPYGTFTFISAMVCLLLAVQWGGTNYAWDNARIIALLVLFAVLFIIWSIIETKTPDTATVPPRIACQRSVAFAFLFTFCIGGTLITLVYFLPIWFQAIKGVTPLKSGYMTTPLVIPQVIGAVAAGKLVGTFGYYKPFMIASGALLAIGCGLITTFNTHTNHAKWIGYQVFVGLGMGFGMQQGVLATQTVLSDRDAKVGSSMIMLALTLGGTIFLAIGQSVFTNHLAQLVSNIPGINKELIINTGAAEIRKVITDPAQLHAVIEAYDSAVNSAFKVVLAVSCLAMVGAVGVEMKSVKHKKNQAGNKAAKAAATAPGQEGKLEKGEAAVTGTSTPTAEEETKLESLEDGKV